MEERIVYVIQRADGQFYWEYQSSLECCGCCGYTDIVGYSSFDKAHLFSTEKGAKSIAKSIASHFSDGQKCKVKQVKVTLVD